MTLKEKLFEEKEEFGGAVPKEAIETLRSFLGFANEQGLEVDERVSDAFKRLECFVKEVDIASPLDMFITEEIPFRLKEIFHIENASQDLIDYINYEKFDDCEGYLNNDYADSIIREGVQEYINNLKVDIANGNTESQKELEELEKAMEK